MPFTLFVKVVQAVLTVVTAIASLRNGQKIAEVDSKVSSFQKIDT